jgi:hypothetical protein
MATPPSNPKALFHYQENGVPQGPCTAQQLKGLAEAGKIQPQTLIWKEGLPQWVPAKNVKGLFPTTAVTAPAPARSELNFQVEPKTSPRPRRGSRLGVLAGLLGLVGLVVGGVVLLVNRDDSTEPKKDDKVEAGDRKSTPPKPTLPKKETQGKAGDKKPTPAKPARPKKPPVEPAKPKPPTPPAAELTIPELMSKYRTDPEGMLAELKGKSITLKLNVNWEIEDVKRCITPDGTSMNIFIYQHGIKWQNAKPDQIVHMHFPIGDPKAKLGFFAKFKDYAEKRKKGDKVTMNVTGTLTTFDHPESKQTFLLVKDAVLN